MVSRHELWASPSNDPREVSRKGKERDRRGRFRGSLPLADDATNGVGDASGRLDNVSHGEFGGDLAEEETFCIERGGKSGLYVMWARSE